MTEADLHPIDFEADPRSPPTPRPGFDWHAPCVGVVAAGPERQADAGRRATLGPVEPSGRHAVECGGDSLQRAMLAASQYGVRRPNGGGALADADQAIAVSDSNVLALFDRAFALFLLGRFDEAWPAYEARWRLPEAAPMPASHPTWSGGPLSGRTVCVEAEQGLGDLVQFARYLGPLADRGARVVVRCPTRAVRLIATARRVHRVVPQKDPAPSADLSIPIMSLPYRLGTGADLLGGSVPYLRPAWGGPRQRNVLHAGLCWAGKPTHRNDRHRSAPLEALLPLLAVPGIRWVSLQMGPAALDLRRVGCAALVQDAQHGQRDLADAAHLVASLDLVIAVDTMVAHLAGALGVPVWLLLSTPHDWRWAAGGATPWYPSMRIFRQTETSDWRDVVSACTQRLRKVVRKTGP